VRVALLLLALACATASSALADDQPWVVGVSPERKARAKQLLHEGNELLVKNQFVQALERYEEAIAAWDHPAIRFNMVRALIALDRVLEANENITKALQYGAAPLEEQIYIEALNYQRLLTGRLGKLQLSCTQQGVTVRVDSVAFACPTTKQITAEPGTHVAISSGDGYQAETHEVTVLPGKTAQVAIALTRLDDVAMEERRRWAAWKPWVVLGAGGGVAIVGTLLNLNARSERDALNNTIAVACAERCSEDEYARLGFARAESRITTRSTASLVTLGVGGAAAVVGVTLVLLNRPTLHRRRAPSLEVHHDHIAVSVTAEF
jgi:hypothetical protein